SHGVHGTPRPRPARSPNRSMWRLRADVAEGVTPGRRPGSDPFVNLPQRIISSLARDGVVTFIDGDDATPVRWTDLHHNARGLAVGLAARGVAPGDKVAILGPTTRDLVTTIQATWLAGATIVVLPLPMRMSSIEEFVSQTRARILGADTAIVVVDPELAPFI